MKCQPINSYKKLKVLALSALCVCLMPVAANAKNNNDDAITQVTANNFTVTTQNLSSRISGYVSNGQISQQQANDFNNELSQISSQAMMTVANPAAAQQSVNVFGNFTNKIIAAAAANGTYNNSGYAYNGYNNNGYNGNNYANGGWNGNGYNNGGWNGFNGRFAQTKADWQARMAQQKAARDAQRQISGRNRWGF
ncbi:MAG: hypothetical protein IPL73_17290 [Candidatus Obscuribacter sp.]|jgi:hypothetical protein|nr:hypothetical protein [Candidatus Obscuribacter sp.]